MDRARRRAVRFAGPHLAAGDDTLVPVPLRLRRPHAGRRAVLGPAGALAPVPDQSPFPGMPIPDDVRMQRQVLAEPTLDLADKTWARLADGTPLVTAEKRGTGLDRADPHHGQHRTGRNLALSGLFVNMLRRLVALCAAWPATASTRRCSRGARSTASAGWARRRPARRSLPADADRDLRPAAIRRASTATRTRRRAFNLGGHVGEPKPLGAAGRRRDRRGCREGGEVDLARWCLLAACLLLLLDLLIVALAARAAAARRALRTRRDGGAAAGFAVAAAGAQAATPAAARRRPGCRQARPDAAQRRAGAQGLARHAPRLHPDRRQGVDDVSKAGPGRPERDAAQPHRGRAGRSGRRRPREATSCAFFPLIYWPITADAARPVAARRGSARPLPAHRRHPVLTRATRQLALRPAGRRQSRPQAAAVRHRDAAAGRRAARPRADQVVLPAVTTCPAAGSAARSGSSRRGPGQ